MELKQRVVAKKVWICNLIKGTYHKSEGWAPGYVEYAGEKYSRVSVVATVVAKFLSEDGNYGTVTLDDGTETIRLKTFGPDVLKIRDILIGAIVRCIGKVRNYNDETYITPEIVFPLNDPNWLILHRLYLGRPEAAPEPEETKPQVSEQVAVQAIKEEVESIPKKILNLIRELDTGIGAEISTVMAKSGLDEDEIKNVLFGLLRSGDIYEPKKGRLKVLD
ncbi:MAG: OB-fold nucleic acid binding domain-containing protein [Candidatus Nanoarchaeia archaeon]